MDKKQKKEKSYRGQENKKEEKEGIPRNLLSVVSNVSNVSNVRTDKTYNLQAIHEGMGKEIKDRIMGLLFIKNPLSYEKISKILDLKYDSIIQNFIRNKQYFQETPKEGKIKFFKLSRLGWEFVKERVDQYEIAQEFLKKVETDKITEKNKEKILIEEAQIIKSSKVYIREGKSIQFSFRELSEISPRFTEGLMTNPEEAIEILKSVFQGDYNIRIREVPESSNVNIENIRNKVLNKLISIEARVVSLSSVKAQTTQIKFECPSCGSVISVIQDELTKKEPTRCSCGRKGKFRVLSEIYEDVSRIILEDLQEKTDNPHTQRINAWIKNILTTKENIKIFTPGNEIKCVGILKKSVKKVKGEGESVFADYWFEIIDAEMFEPELNIENFTNEEIKEIEEVANKINTYGLREINDSFAPEIVGENQIKNALILQLCSRKNNINDLIRNKPNLLLIGDPGTAKSILCKFLIKINPESRECSGGGSSAVGITASVIKEEESMGGYRIEPGALVLAKDCLFIDELNNLSDDDKPKLQEAMSEQIIRINKAGLHLKLKVTAGIIATANPKYGSFKKSATYISQFNLPEPIINRFDLIFILNDIHNKERDEMIANQMLAREKGEISVKYSKDFLKRFFIYVRGFEEPQFSGSVEQQIKKVYLKIRKENSEEDIIINPRALESLIRLVKASAKSRLSRYVEEKDIETALKILGRSHFRTSEYSKFNFQEETETDLINN